MPFDIVLVDDHKLVRDGVRTILERGSEFHVVGEAENGAEAVQLCKKTAPDLVMLDLGLQTIRSYRKTMMKKLSVNNVAGLTQLALAAGITHWNKPDANSLG